MTGPMRLDLGQLDDEPRSAASALPGVERTAAPASSSATSRQTQSLYRRYRPQSFDADDLVGQEHIIRTLRNAVERGRVAHAYLFCGPRGTGKTTTARLLAKAVNCLDPDPRARPCNRCANCLAITSGATTDVIEIDAASNRGIDDIRDLRERVKYAPVQLQTKFYIIDEAHQITGAAANAFLKTLEEPPPHTKFVLATTDPEDLLPTIVSRCQRFDFRRISLPAAMSRIRTVAAAEGLEIDDEAVAAIARAGTGSLRDSLGLLDQLAVYEEGEHDGDASPTITADSVRALLGVSRNDRVEIIATALADRDVSSALQVVNAAVEAGEDPRQLNRQLVNYLRVLMHELAGGSPDADDRAHALAPRFDLYELARMAQRFSETDVRIRHASIAQLPLEVALVESMLQPAQAGSAPAPPWAGAESASPRRAERPVAPGKVAEPTTASDPQTSANASGNGVEPPPPASGPSLRERVRNSGTRVGQPRQVDPDASPPAAQPAPVSASTTPGAPAAEHPTEAPGSPAPSTDGADAVAKLVTLWPRIRQDVKLQNRRIEALLAEVDPVDVQGDLVILRAAYPFHRNRLEEDEVRTVVEITIGRRYGDQVRVRTILRGEEGANGVGTVAAIPTAPATPARPAPGGPTAGSPGTGQSESAAPPLTPTETPGEATADMEVAKETASGTAAQETATASPPAQPSPEDVEEFIRAAKTIFDGEEIPDPLAESDDDTPSA